MTLFDALSQYRSVSDSTHRFWAYFQAIAIGTAAFAWSREGAPDKTLLAILTIAFIAFAVASFRLVVDSQGEAVIAARCIKDYASGSGANLPPELAPMIQRIDPDSAVTVGMWHVAISVATLCAVWWNCFAQAR